jgi:hypothetical protein
LPAIAIPTVRIRKEDEEIKIVDGEYLPNMPIAIYEEKGCEDTERIYYGLVKVEQENVVKIWKLRLKERKEGVDVYELVQNRESEMEEFTIGISNCELHNYKTPSRQSTYWIPKNEDFIGIKGAKKVISAILYEHLFKTEWREFVVSKPSSIVEFPDNCQLVDGLTETFDYCDGEEVSVVALGTYEEKIGFSDKFIRFLNRSQFYNYWNDYDRISAILRVIDDLALDNNFPYAGKDETGLFNVLVEKAVISIVPTSSLLDRIVKELNYNPKVLGDVRTFINYFEIPLDEGEKELINKWVQEMKQRVGERFEKWFAEILKEVDG